MKKNYFILNVGKYIKKNYKPNHTKISNFKKSSSLQYHFKLIRGLSTILLKTPK